MARVRRRAPSWGAGYEKMFEGSFGNLLGMDNSSLQAMNMMKQYGKDDLYLGSHSRGTLTVSNALKALNTEDNREKKLLSNTTVKWWVLQLMLQERMVI